MTPPPSSPVPPVANTPTPPPTLTVPTLRVAVPPPRVAMPPPRVTAPPPRVVPIDIADKMPESVIHRTRSRVSAISTALGTFPPKFIEQWAASKVLHDNQWEPLALSVLDTEIGQTLEHCALCSHPRLATTWNNLYSNNLGRLCQIIGTDSTDPTQKRVKGINIFHVILYDDIPPDRRKGIAVSKVVCKFPPNKSDPNCTRITITG